LNPTRSHRPGPFGVWPTAAAIIALYKGPIYRERQPETWRDLIADQASVRAYCAVIGLELFVDEAEGFAFLRQATDTGDEDDTPLPRLIPRHNRYRQGHRRRRQDDRVRSQSPHRHAQGMGLLPKRRHPALRAAATCPSRLKI
jgi:hypothetical protein